MRYLTKKEQASLTKAISKVYKPTGVKLFEEERGMPLSMDQVKPTCTFQSFENLIAYLRPLILEGYPLSVETVFNEIPYQESIRCFNVYVGDKVTSDGSRNE